MKKILFLLLITAMVMTGCSSTEEVKEPVKIGLLPIEDSLPLYIAEAENLFAKNNVDVELVAFNSARERDMALQSGDIDGEVADVLAAALLEKSGIDVSIISLTLGATPGEGRFALLTSPNSGLRSPEQLKNVTVGISENTIIEYVLDQLLQLHGIPIEDVNKEAIPRIPERLQLLLSDKIDAALLPDPLASLAEAKGAHVILDDTKVAENISQVVLLFSKETIAKNEEAIARILAAYNDAVQMFNTNPNKYQELFIEKARVPKDIQDTYRPPVFSQAQVPRKADIDRLLQWMQDKELIGQELTYEQLVDDRFVKD
ncbi:MAG: ABC transporter substrate-binding protein [Thermoanaerobacteraceae bacterium]|nr:ABC transporter substrate-binding protein [Thermoanaerobacteraceae bacterium]